MKEKGRQIEMKLPKQVLSRSGWLLTTLLMAITLILFPLSAFAEDGLAFYVTPIFPESQREGEGGYFDLQLGPGTHDKLTLSLQNGGDEPVLVQITPHTAFTNVNGVVEYGREAEEADPTLIYSLEDLVTPIEPIEIAGGGTQEVTLELTMPDDAFEGVLAGGLRIEEIREEAPEETRTEEGVAITNEFAYVIGVLVRNEMNSISPDLALLEVFADQINHRNVFSATIQNFMPAFANRLSVEAQVRREGETEILYEETKENMQMAPNSQFNFPISLNGDRFQSGSYELMMTARSGENEWQWTEMFTVEADEARRLNRQDVLVEETFSWWMILGVLLISVLIGLVIFLLYKNKKQQKRDDTP